MWGRGGADGEWREGVEKVARAVLGRRGAVAARAGAARLAAGGRRGRRGRVAHRVARFARLGKTGSVDEVGVFVGRHGNQGCPDSFSFHRRTQPWLPGHGNPGCHAQNMISRAQSLGKSRWVTRVAFTGVGGNPGCHGGPLQRTHRFPRRYAAPARSRAPSPAGLRAASAACVGRLQPSRAPIRARAEGQAAQLLASRPCPARARPRAPPACGAGGGWAAARARAQGVAARAPAVDAVARSCTAAALPLPQAECPEQASAWASRAMPRCPLR